MDNEIINEGNDGMGRNKLEEIKFKKYLMIIVIIVIM